MKLRPKLLLFVTAIVCALLFVGISIPLINRAVEPNPFYGIRIGVSYESDELWYEVNRYGGWAMTIAGLVLLIGNIILYLFRKKLSGQAYTGIFVGIMLLCILTATVITVAYAESLV